ncbi:CpsD/CapB family tyrosine-protein kinase [Methylocaldum gracile]|jgi:Mrp family chromosome partitioning ATPase|uniref:CpsD/CapB family tyrosine-protein kinase n=1 Tax=unclassified Methylocaldum TaxID=2622260 RepID=UPI003DA073B3
MESIAPSFATPTPGPRGGSPQAPAPAERIEYTTTRSIEVRREVLRRQRLIAGYPPGPYVDAYKVLRTKVLQILRERGWNALAVTSPNPQAGKTVAAINLALSLALDVSQTVLLVDANLRHPSVHTAFGFTPQYGLSDYLLDDVPIERLLINPKGIGRFVVLPGHRPLPDASELLASPKMARLVDELKHRYPSRIVVFDLPHLTTADALAFAPHVDAALLVLEAGRTTHAELEEALAHLNTTPLLGTLLNKAEPGPGS